METKAGSSNPISLGDEALVRQVLVDSILGLWDVVNNLTRLKPSARERYRVTIFGSARVKAGTFAYDETKRLAATLADLDCEIITGGGPGLMQAANEGAASRNTASYGIRVDLPFEQESNAFVTEAYEHRTFFTRLHQFVLASDAFVVAPGGIGTVLELTLIWQLLQVNHLLRETPLVLVGHMWPGLIAWARESMLGTEPPLAHPEDLEIPRCVANADEAIAIIRESRAAWMSRKSIESGRSEGLSSR
jgi:uncharacterized protein (TIGR00730 family)